MKQEEKDEMFYEIAEEIAELLCKKNHDYGDSAHEVYVDLGDIVIYVRLLDKINRLRTKVKGGEFKIADESVKDIYRDMAGYCILALASMERLQTQEVKSI